MDEATETASLLSPREAAEALSASREEGDENIETTANEEPSEGESEVTEDSSESVEGSTEEVTAEESEDDAQTGESEALELSEYASLLGIDESALDVNDAGEPVFRVKVDGEDGTATLEELRESYQLKGHLHRRITEASDSEKSQQAQLEEFTKQREEFGQNSEAVLRAAYNMVMGDAKYAPEALEALRHDDPGEYAARVAERQNREQQFYALAQQAFSLTPQVSPEEMAQRAQSEQAALYRAIPEWENTVTETKEKADLASYLASTGFSTEELNGLGDHRQVVLARKAMLYDQLQNKTPKITAKVRKAPKLVKGGSGTPAASEREKAAKRFEANPTIDNALAAMRASRGG
jgi:hypothetical protein